MKPETKSYSEDKASAIAFLNQDSDLLSKKLINEASTGIVSYEGYPCNIYWFIVNVSGLSIATGREENIKKQRSSKG